MLSGILSDILFWRSIWHLFWHSLLAFYLVYCREFFVVEAREHSEPELAVEVRRGTLNLSLLFGSGGEHSDPELAVEVRRGTLWSWGVRQGTLRSSACSWGPAGITLKQRLLFGSDREHCDLALAAEVRLGSLWSRGCCPGPAGNIAI